MTASDALIHYKGRDISEKLFSSDKSFIGSKSMRVQSNEALSAKIFIEFIALIVRNRIYNLLKDTLLKAEIKKVENELLKVQQKQETLEARLLKLQKAKHEIESRQIMDAFHNISKSLRELMIFLEG